MVSKVIRAVIGIGVIAAFMAGCADVPSTGPTPPDPQSQMRFVNADPGLPNVTVSVDNAARGTLAYQAGSSYGEYPAGSRKVSLSPGTAADTARIAFTTDRRSTIFILPQVSGARDFFKVNERFVYTAPGVATRALVRVINLSDVATGVGAGFLGPDTVGTSAALAFKGTTPYAEIEGGAYVLTLTAGGQTTPLITANINVAVNKRYTFAVVGTAAAAALVSLIDD